MTTPSETMAGKLPELPSSLLLVEVHDDEYGHVRRTADDDYYTADQMRAYALEALAASEPGEAVPVPIILHCPSCHLQHVDEPDERTPDWTNPPHRSHLCHGCGYIWRPADVATVGVAAIKTKGKADSPAPEQPGKGEGLPPDVSKLCTETGEPEWPQNCTCPIHAQPSDPAEGEPLSRKQIVKIIRAITDNDDVTNAQGHSLVDSLILEASLSTPPTAAVSVDDAAIDRARNSYIAHKRFHCKEGETISDLDRNEREAWGKALTAALDPQVKR